MTDPNMTATEYAREAYEHSPGYLCPTCGEEDCICCPTCGLHPDYCTCEGGGEG